MSDPFVAEIRMFGGNFAPTGWAECNGQLMPISQNTALFSLLGTFYGGDGKSTFALPNLQGSVPVGQGQGAGLSSYDLGQSSGSQTARSCRARYRCTPTSCRPTTTISPMPTPSPTMVLGRAQGGASPYRADQNNTTMNVQATSVAGGSLPHNNLMPFLVVNFIIAMQGVFPPRG
jgi:microcystin-dependent protein